MKNKRNKVKIITIGLLAGFGLGVVLAVVGLSRVVAELDAVAISGEPEAVLASAGVENGADVSLSVTYFDQRQDACVNMYDKAAYQDLAARQFEWASCGYHYQEIEPGLVEYQLNEKYLPVAVGGKMLSNRGLADMARWFDNVEGQSKAYSGVLKLQYNAEEFGFSSEEFYPLDAAEFSAGDAVNKDGHNHLFTLSFAVPFTVRANGAESFEVTADDDTFVYVGDRLALDMGGVHGAVKGQLTIRENGEVYTAVDGEEMAYSGITVKEDTGSVIRIFHADRDAGNGSEFGVKLAGMNLNIVQAQLASGSNAVQVAYDSGEGYVGPLGESKVVRPDETRGYMIEATLLGVAVVTGAVFMVVAVGALVKNRQ